MARITPDTPQRGAARNLLNVVDNYYRPARDRMGEAAMSQGLNAASGIAQTMARKGIEEDIKEAEIKAKADAALGEGPDEELKQVRLGNLFRPHSKAYNQVYSEAMGRKAAIEFNENLTLEYEKSGLKYNTNPEKFREWMNGKVNAFLKEPAHQNEYFLAGAVQTVQQQTVNMGAAHMSNVSAQMERNHLASIKKQADDIALRVSSGEYTIEEGLAKSSTLMGQAYGSSLPAGKSRAAFLSSWLATADASDNVEMGQALLDARESGALKLRPDEWLTISNNVEKIEKDVAFRKSLQIKEREAQDKQNLSIMTDAAADFFMDPNNQQMNMADFLQMPSGQEDGQTMYDLISSLPNTSAVMDKVESTFKTLKTVYTPDARQESINTFLLRQAKDNGEFTDQTSFIDWAEKTDLPLSDKNFTETMDALANANDPESAYGTQSYKKGRPQAINRIIDVMNADAGLTFNAFGEAEGEMAPTITLQFDDFLNDRLNALPEGKAKDPDAVAAAILAAEKDTMEFLRETERAAYDKAFNAYGNQRDASTTLANPFLEGEAARLQEEQRVEDEAAFADYSDLSNETVPFTRPDLEVQAAAIEIYKIEAAAQAQAAADAEANKSDYAKWKEMSRSERRAAGLPESVIGGEIEFRRFMSGIVGEDLPSRTQLREQEQAERQAGIEADAALMGEAAKLAERLSTLDINATSLDAIGEILADIQQQLNITIPTNYQELEFLGQDLMALQEETGVKINQEVMAKLLQAAMERF